jgi:hypothetical protein
MSIKIEELRSMLASHKEGLELQRVSYAQRVLEKVQAIGRIEEEKLHSQLIDSMIRDLHLYNAHLRDIERELHIVKHYEFMVRVKEE